MVNEEYKYDALVVLGAVMEWNARLGKWEFPALIDRYPGKLVMGKVRALAACEAEKLAPLVLVTGGSDQNPETAETGFRSAELSSVMTETYSMPKEKVVPIGTSKASHTVGNAENVAKYLTEHPEILTRRRIAILCPRFQAERAELIFNMNPYFKNFDISIDWLMAEDFVTAKYPHLKKWLDRINASPAALENIRLEKQGIEDLKSGKYQPGRYTTGL